MATTPDLPSATEPDSAGSTRARLLDAAYELLVRDGYNATTVQGVARRAGLTTGAIYANFVNKQELMALAVLDRWNHLQAQLIAMAPDAGAPAVDDWAMQLIAQLMSAPPAPEHRLLTEVTGAVLRDTSGGESPLLAGVQMMETLIRDWVETAKKQGSVDEKLPTAALVAVILNVYLGAITSKSWGLDQPELDDVVQVLNAAVKGWGPDTRS